MISQLKLIWEHTIIVAGQKDDFIAGSLLDYPYFEEPCKMIHIDLSKQQVLNTGPKSIQKIKITGNLRQEEGGTMFFISEEVKKTILDFSQRTVRVL